MQFKTPELLHVMAGTAGHVDHGKTSLVRLLTGCETDRLKEEKERGMSIVLGFAPCHIPGNRVFGIIDVPGHIDFIKNMVAGAASMDIIIFVIAADDGIMPQTVEHMQIIRLLRSPLIMVALTKKDVVDEATLGRRRDEISRFMTDNGFPDVPVVPVSNVTLDGISEVRNVLSGLVESVVPRKDVRVFRMNIERVFSVKGFGTVVSGIPLSGTVRIDDELELHPSGKRVHVKAIQNYKHEAQETSAGTCSALNLRGIEPEEAGRGMTLAAPGFFFPVKSLIVEISNIGADFSVRHNMEVKFHSGTSELNARILLFDKGSIGPGRSSAARIRLDDVVVLAPGDKFIVRSLSPSATIGGGTVLLCGESLSKRNAPGFSKGIDAALDSLRKSDFFQAALACSGESIVEHAGLLKLSGLVPTEAEALISEKVKGGFLIALRGGAYMIRMRLDELLSTAAKTLKSFHDRNKLAIGMDAESFCRTFKIKAANFAALLDALASAPGSEIKSAGGKAALKSFSPGTNPKMLELKAKVLAYVEKTGVNCAAAGNIVADLRIPEADLKAAVKMLADEKSVVVIGNHLIAAGTFDTCRRKASEIFKAKGVIEIGDFKAASGAGRNMAVAILEKFDAIGFTKRTPSGRVVVGKL